MDRVGELFGFPIFVSPKLRPGEVALIGIGDGLEVAEVHGRELILRRRTSAALIVGVESDRTRDSVPAERHIQLALEGLEP